MQLAENVTLQSGKFRILRVLGQGGFGITYLAENVALGKKVAIKEFFPKDFCGRDEATLAISSFTGGSSELLDRLKKRFLKEARNIATLDHPGIVKIHDIFEENGTAYYVMDYIEGENLNEKVKREGALPEKRAVEYIRKVGEALSYIHSRNMTHFDVKPANIVVRKSDDFPILIDFGLSKQYDIHGDATSTLMQGISSGYSPLELYNPGSLATFSPQTDIYSLGATLSFLLTGSVPPPAPEVVTNGMTFSPSLNPAIVHAITVSMQANRNLRGASITEFLGSLGTKSSSASPYQNSSIALTSESTRLIDESTDRNQYNEPPLPPTTGNSSKIAPDSAAGDNSNTPPKSDDSIVGKIIIIIAIIGIGLAILINQCHSGYNYDTQVIGDTIAEDSDYIIEIVDEPLWDYTLADSVGIWVGEDPSVYCDSCDY